MDPDRRGAGSAGHAGHPLAEALRERYKLAPDPEADGFTLLERAAKQRGFLVSRGEYDLERMANTLLTEYHDGKLGRLSLEMPPDDGTVDN